MSTKQKVLLIGLAVVLVVLFVVAVGVGRGRDEGDPKKPPGIVELLGRLGRQQSAVDPNTVTADCQVDGKPATFTFTGSCTLTVADPGGMKLLTLRSSKQFTVEAPAPGGAGVRVKDTVDPSPTPGGLPQAIVQVAVDTSTQIELRCPFGTECTVVATRG
jgi:hypothetical protein